MQATPGFVEPDRILHEVLLELHPYGCTEEQQAIYKERFRRLRLVLAYACRLHWRSGYTEDTREALKRFAQYFLCGQIPYYD